MPIKIHDNLPARKLLQDEIVDVIDSSTAKKQDIRTLKFLLLLVDRNRIEVLDSIAQKFLELSYKQESIEIAKITSSIQLSAEDAKLMVQDCLNVILRTGLDNQEREEALKEKYSMEALSLDEKRELQQILLKKDKMSVEEASLLKNLSSK